MMYAVVYLSSKLGRRAGACSTSSRIPKWILWPALIGVLAGNTIEAAADLGGVAAAINIFVPVPIPLLVLAVAGIIFALQTLDPTS